MYDLPYDHTLAVQKGYRNESYPVRLKDGSYINLIFFKPDADILTRITNADFVSKILSERNIPGRKRIHSNLITLRSASRTTYAGIYNYLPGNTIPWEAYTMEHIKSLGHMLSDMHSSIKDVERPKGMNQAADELDGVFDKMHDYFSDESVQNALKQKLGVLVYLDSIKKLQKIVSCFRQTSHDQILHMDFVRGNVLFSEHKKSKITGVIDFEKTSYGHPLFDIARTLAFLLVDCKYKDEDKIRKYFLYSGYNKRGQSTLPRVSVKYGGETHNLLWVLARSYLLYDFYKFLRHNPYEFLEDNEHFVRTRNILVKNNMIYYNK